MPGTVFKCRPPGQASLSFRFRGFNDLPKFSLLSPLPYSLSDSSSKLHPLSSPAGRPATVPPGTVRSQFRAPGYWLYAAHLIALQSDENPRLRLQNGQSLNHEWLSPPSDEASSTLLVHGPRTDFFLTVVKGPATCEPPPRAATRPGRPAAARPCSDGARPLRVRFHANSKIEDWKRRRSDEEKGEEKSK